ncbi:MAG: T9SS type A sorting domain-containing protein [Chitinophagales bacterium]|nr:T9SS type A sorting domain-containing protein [Chitinophagales bacterium]
MKLLLTFILALWLTLPSYAQITITSANTPDAGDNFVAQGCDTTGVEPGNSGANITWNFSSLVPSGETVTYEYVAPEGTPFASSFPSASIVQNVLNSLYIYYNVNESSQSLLGIGGSVMVEVYDNPELLISFPFTYNSTLTDPFSASYEILGLTNYHFGTHTLTADAYGTLILPTGTYNNVLRVKSNTDAKDSMYIFGSSTVNHDVTSSWIWYTAGGKSPILEIVKTTTTSQSETIHSKSVAYKSEGTFIAENNAVQNISISPNPVADAAIITVNFKNAGAAVINVLDMAGNNVQPVYSGPFHRGVNNFQFNRVQLSAGMYLLEVNAGGVRELVKFVIW